MYELTVKTSFDAAHKLCGYQGNCARIHGHTWVVEVAVAGGKLDSIGMLIDFKDLKNMVKKATAHLDHNFINELPEFAVNGKVGNPTAENLSRYIYEQVKEELDKNHPSVKIRRVSVWESPNSCATYRED
ncbi:6-carboxytetrahydropterin synthase QueD [Desulfofalx alkaliphila]|uniref:6-carboxytetrahydropterin synthase QueD n=1 Tax=Desulfofalx alkaliphila TaxID=105483 RepID=UPI0004E22BC5|nr:6-carboxytetrahydropterin synthase QueD [Desulfofalx alkaliphila]